MQTCDGAVTAASGATLLHGAGIINPVQSSRLRTIHLVLHPFHRTLLRRLLFELR